MQDFRVGIRNVIGIEGRLARAAAVGSLIVLAVHWALVINFVAVRAGSLSFLRLHYTVAYGIDWVDKWWLIFTFPLLGLAFFCLNAWIASLLAHARPTFGTIVHVATLIIEVALAAAGAIAILLNS